MIANKDGPNIFEEIHASGGFWAGLGAEIYGLNAIPFNVYRIEIAFFKFEFW